jgi:hypothetical protein
MPGGPTRGRYGSMVRDSPPAWLECWPRAYAVDRPGGHQDIKKAPTEGGSHNFI